MPCGLALQLQPEIQTFGLLGAFGLRSRHTCLNSYYSYMLNHDNTLARRLFTLSFMLQENARTETTWTLLAEVKLRVCSMPH